MRIDNVKIAEHYEIKKCAENVYGWFDGIAYTITSALYIEREKTSLLTQILIN